MWETDEKTEGKESVSKLTITVFLPATKQKSGFRVKVTNKHLNV